MRSSFSAARYAACACSGVRPTSPTDSVHRRPSRTVKTAAPPGRARPGAASYSAIQSTSMTYAPFSPRRRYDAYGPCTASSASRSSESTSTAGRTGAVGHAFLKNRGYSAPRIRCSSLRHGRRLGGCDLLHQPEQAGLQLDATESLLGVVARRKASSPSTFPSPACGDTRRRRARTRADRRTAPRAARCAVSGTTGT